MSQTLAEQAEYWQTLRPQRVSLVGPHIDGEGLAEARRVLVTGDYRLETIVHPFLPGQQLGQIDDNWQQARACLSRQIDNAQQLGAKSIYMVTGGLGELLWEEAAAAFAEAITPCREQAQEAGVELLIENTAPQYADLHIAHSLRDTVKLAEMAGIGVCIDLFSCWTESDLKVTIESAVARCHLVQVSDNVAGDRTLPARAVPGDGDIPLARLFDWILQSGYTGAFDLELLGPRIEEEGALAATARAAVVVDELLQSLNV
ncbi:MAG: sugar phosphate isomerase/epimerase family protein [Gammaproteobacteria bacterium]